MVLATLGAGCFWGVEASFQKIKGVRSTTVGYSGGVFKNPRYEDVCTGETGHAEVVQIEFDVKQVSYKDLLKIFWGCHDPTQLNRQGPDIGTQYRSIIFFHDSTQKDIAKTSLKTLESSGKHSKPIATQIVEACHFYPAEEYHQQYLAKRGLIKCH